MKSPQSALFVVLKKWRTGMVKIFPEDSVFITGVAKVSKEDAINAMYGAFSLSMIIDIHTNTIINASANMVMEDTNLFLREILVEKNIVTDIALISEIIKKRFLALAQKAVLVALRDAQNRYLMAYPEAKL